MSLWEPITIESKTGRCIRLGAISLWLHHERDEWHIAVERATDGEIEPTEQHATIEESTPPEDLDWQRWVVTGESPIVQLTPIMPDRPIVVRPESQIGIHHNSKAVFFVSIPIWLRIHVGKDKAQKLCEIPSAVLSNIWFGDPMSGELCYSLRTRARRDLDAGPTQPHCAVCPVTLHNGSTEDLDFERLCIRVAHLRVYESPKQLWTNAVTVSFRGVEQVSDISYEDRPPKWESVGKPLSDAREPVKANVFQRSFGNVRSFAGF